MAGFQSLDDLLHMDDLNPRLKMVLVAVYSERRRGNRMIHIHNLTKATGAKNIGPEIEWLHTVGLLTVTPDAEEGWATYDMDSCPNAPRW